MEKQNTNQTYNNATEILKYRFEFGSDECIYSVSFKGIISERYISKILESASTHLYKDCGDFTQSFLYANHLSYSDFNFCKKQIDHPAIMEFSEKLLHNTTCGSIDQWIGSTDVYYGIMDHQHKIGANCYEGCYYAVSRTPFRKTGEYEYHIIGQTFQFDEVSDKEQSYFAIRQNKGRIQLHTLDAADDEPVLTTFGCVDIARLLTHIQTVTTRQQAANLANR